MVLVQLIESFLIFLLQVIQSLSCQFLLLFQLRVLLLDDVLYLPVQSTCLVVQVLDFPLLSLYNILILSSLVIQLLSHLPHLRLQYLYLRMMALSDDWQIQVVCPLLILFQSLYLQVLVPLHLVNCLMQLFNLKQQTLCLIFVLLVQGIVFLKSDIICCLVQWYILFRQLNTLLQLCLYSVVVLNFLFPQRRSELDVRKSVILLISISERRRERILIFTMGLNISHR